MPFTPREGVGGLRHPGDDARLPKLPLFEGGPTGGATPRRNKTATLVAPEPLPSMQQDDTPTRKRRGTEHKIEREVQQFIAGKLEKRPPPPKPKPRKGSRQRAVSYLDDDAFDPPRDGAGSVKSDGAGSFNERDGTGGGGDDGAPRRTSRSTQLRPGVLERSHSRNSVVAELMQKRKEAAAEKEAEERKQRRLAQVAAAEGVGTRRHVTDLSSRAART